MIEFRGRGIPIRVIIKEKGFEEDNGQSSSKNKTADERRSNRTRIARITRMRTD